MARWQPDARGRLARAAMELYAQRGFDSVTAPEIAERAGMHERSFFRLFPDKREALFAGSELTQQVLTRTIRERPSGSPLQRVGRAIEAMCEKFQEDPTLVRMRESIISANPELTERNLAKHADFVEAMSASLVEQGVAPGSARLAAETGMAVFRTAFGSWIADPGDTDLPTVFRRTFQELRVAVAEPSPAAGTNR
jgi:AcrR family transcriptional regulator